MFNYKNFFRILLDIVLLVLALVFATLIRLEGDFLVPANAFIWHKQLKFLLIAITSIQFSVLFFSQTYKSFWRYTGINEIISLAKALFIAFVLILIPRFMGQSPNSGDIFAVSYGVAIIDFLFALTLLGRIRLLRAYLIEQRNIKRRLIDLASSAKRTLIIGAGEAALEVVKSINQHPELALELVAALDDDKRKHNMILASAVPVKGSIDELQYWVSELNIEQIIIAIPSLKPQDLRRISRLASDTSVPVRIIPGVDQLAGGKVSVESIRKLNMEDLLGREPVDLNSEEVITFLKNKRVLVTGAGGSIGRELTLQLIRNCDIQAIALLGKGENTIFDTAMEIKATKPEQKLETYICDIRNYERSKMIFQEFKPDIVFHAAAHKHVHLMELNPCEAFENNVLGTRNMAELAACHGVSSFVLISTDKSVNPSSIMGCTKNLAERMILFLAKQYPETKFTAVRFGNVLGSRGSVIKIWEKQISEGRAITVTHKDAFRYFMTIPEAAQLVIQAAAKAQSGEIMVLDMGEAVKIFDLAQQFIRLSGFNSEDIEIQITGLKEGEKLHEELLTSAEFIESKLTEKIFRAKIDTNYDIPKFLEKIQELEALATENDNIAMKKALRNGANVVR